MKPFTPIRYFLLSCVAILLLLLLPNFIICSTGSHGHFCNETQPCTTSALLTCQDSTCQCILHDSMVFVPPRGDGVSPSSSPDQGHCVSMVDEVCGQMSMDTSEIVLECVANAFCNPQGECQCHIGYFKNDGLCLIQLGFRDECNSSLECSQSLGLSCVNESCQCNSTVSIDSFKFFDDDGHDGGHRCLGRPGQSCLNGHCVPNAECKEEEDVRIGGMLKNTCICDPGFEESKMRKVCVGSYNKTCDTQSNRFCRKDLSCIKGLCGCKHPTDQIYNKETRTCVSLVGGPCVSIGECVTNAACKRLGSEEIIPLSSDHVDIDETDEDRSKSIYEYCECGDGFVENMNRTCDVAYGHPCSQMLEDWKCDTLTGLTCRDGFCGCPDPSQIFDKEKCRGMVGSFCHRNLRDECVKNAHCKPHRNGFLPFGHCECDEDYEITADRSCHCQYCK